MKGSGSPDKVPSVCKLEGKNYVTQTGLGSVHEFYKKGCQEKKLRLDRRREDLFLDIQPTVCKSASRFEREVLVVACLPSLWGSSADGDDANRVWKG